MNIALIGYGKMGRMIESVAKARGHNIVSIIDIDNLADFDSQAFASADVAIEFTSPTSAYDNCIKAFERGVKVVSGSTGWVDKHSEELRQMCQEGGKTLFWSSNFSVGVAIFSALNKYLARIMDSFEQYNISLVETHHTHKADAPSGTAITLAEQIIDAVGRKSEWIKGRQILADGTVVDSKDVASYAIPIESRRIGEVPGTHCITYDSEADAISIIHEAHSRKGFALGAVLAAEYTQHHNGLLTIDDLFHF